MTTIVPCKDNETSHQIKCKKRDSSEKNPKYINQINYPKKIINKAYSCNEE